MSKRREAFLNKKVPLTKFTKKAIVQDFNISETEFEELIHKGFIVENNETICVECFRPKDTNNENCFYCGEEETTVTKGFYKYA